MGGKHSEISVTLLWPYPCLESLTFLLESPEKLCSASSSPSATPCKTACKGLRAARGQHGALGSLHGPDSSSSLFLAAAPRAFSRGLLLLHTPFTQPQAGNWKDGIGKLVGLEREGGDEEGGKKEGGLEERGSLSLIYYEFSWETACRLESEW